MLDKILYTVLNLFCCTVAFVLTLNECENVSKRIKIAAMQHTPFFFFFFFFYQYTIPPHHLNKTDLLIHIKYWYRKVEKHTGLVEFKKCVINS